MKIRRLTTAGSVIDAIGSKRLQAITGKRSNNLWNWRTAGCFPPETFVVIQDELARIECAAPPRLWKMIAPKKAKRAA